MRLIDVRTFLLKDWNFRLTIQAGRKSEVVRYNYMAITKQDQNPRTRLHDATLLVAAYSTTVILLHGIQPCDLQYASYIFTYRTKFSAPSRCQKIKVYRQVEPFCSQKRKQQVFQQICQRSKVKEIHQIYFYKKQFFLFSHLTFGRHRPCAEGQLRTYDLQG